jgi:hypothetical protein
MKSKRADMSVWYAVCKVCHQPFPIDELNIDCEDGIGTCDNCIKCIPPVAPVVEQRYL